MVRLQGLHYNLSIDYFNKKSADRPNDPFLAKQNNYFYFITRTLLISKRNSYMNIGLTTINV